MNILQVNYYDTLGGAARISWYLFNRYREAGHASFLAVGQRLSSDPAVFEIPNDRFRGPWAGFWNRAQKRFDQKYHLRLLPGAARLLAALTEPERWRNRRRGFDDFCFPATRHVLALPPVTPDLLHLHNLHGSYFYFDLRQLAELSRRIPVFVTLHDEWMLTGHCAFTLGCERWRSGCGQCPDLTIYPAIRADGTARNLATKGTIYRASRLHVACPSRWLLERAQASVLGPAMVSGRVIRNGVDTSVFRPRERRAARQALGLAEAERMLLFVAHGTRSNRFKDHSTVRQAFLRLIEANPEPPVRLVCLGEAAANERFGRHAIDYVGYIGDLHRVARYYAAADVHLHATRSDSFSNTVAEASACGIPVVATAVGAIPELLEDGGTGFLVPPGDSAAMAARTGQLLDNPDLSRRLGREGARRMQERYSLATMTRNYLDWYEEILAACGSCGR